MALWNETDAGATGTWSGFAHVDLIGNGGATLRVEPGLLTVEIGAALGLFKRLKRLEKRRGEVLVSHVKLRPPWMSTVVRLDDRSVIDVGAWARRRVRDCLRSAGFTVIEERVWSRPSRRPLMGDVERVALWS